MKEFNLDAALNGEPVQLRNGQKAYVVGLSKVGTEDGNSYIVGEYERNLCSWSKDGKYWLKRESEWDIVGMWEEPKLTSEQVLEKAYQEGLRFRFDDVFEYPVIGKARGGSYLLGDERNTYIMWCEDFGKPEICREDTAEPSPKSDTITVTLPKPFKPKDGEAFYYIYEYGIGYVKSYKEDDDGDVGLAKNAQCYRTKEDARKWLDFMKSMME